jgi:exonuclease SbcD
VVPLRSGRRLAEFTGTLDELAARADRIGDAFVKVTVATEQPTPGLAETVTALLPKATVVRVDEDCAASRVTVLDRAVTAAEAEPDLRDLFRDYLAENNTSGVVVDHVMGTFGELLAAASHDEPEPCPEETLLRDAIEELT